ncbi:MAG TPA: serine hydrolase [Candidatus Saccharimonadales bacterium]|nr:serine hydrolase [Candidatus Saccharimonadales bacterium]
MRQKLFAAVAVILFAFISLNFTNTTKAQTIQTDTNITLEDAVYADLALRHYLTSISVDSFDQYGENVVEINKDKQWLPASTVKTYVAMYAYYKINKGQLSLDDQIFIDPINVVPTELDTEELPTLSEGQTVSVDRLIVQMITQSDNTAYNVLLDVLDRQEVSKYIQSLGLTHSTIGSKLNLDYNQAQSELNVEGYGINTTTASDYASAFEMIRQKQVPGADALFETFSMQKINNMIPLLLPKDVKVAHKTGDLDPLYHDGGIVSTPQSAYILSVFSNLGDPDIIAHISDLIYTKNYDLVGAEIQDSTSQNFNWPIDPLVLNIDQEQNLLGTKDVSDVPIPSINAADLGIKPSDLSLDVSRQNLPSVLIPADSPVHFLISASQLVRGVFQDKTQKDLDGMNLKLAEASDLTARGKTQLATATLVKVQGQLDKTAQSEKLSGDSKTQSAIQAISETRFTLLGQGLTSSDKSQRDQTIKTIAKQARETLAQVQPKIPQAVSATSLSQKPLIGDVTDVSDSNLTIKTPDGQDVTVAITKDIKVKDKSQDNTNTKKGAITPGSTIALFGSSDGKNTFNASFVLTNLPKQLVAPQPSIVLKVNKEDKTMVVSENGVPIQVNITPKTIIKGDGTNITLDQIKPNDVVVVRGENVSGQQPQNSNSPANNLSPASSSSPQPQLQPAPSSATAPKQSNSSVNSPDAKKSQTQQPQSSIQPQVIKGTTIQTVQKKEDVGKKVSSTPAPAQNNKSTNNQKPTQPSAPAPTPAQPQTQTKSDDKGKK